MDRDEAAFVVLSEPTDISRFLRCEVHQPRRAWAFPGGPLSHHYPVPSDQLRGLPPMSGQRMDGIMNSMGAEAAEDGGRMSQVHEEQPSGAKAQPSLSAPYGTTEVVPFQNPGAGKPITLAQVRKELKAVKGKRYWKSVDELADTAEFQAAVEKEFPGSAQEWVDPVSRRGFMKLMGASLALAGLAGCTKQPDEPIFPYVKQPEDLILGKPNYFATAHPFVTGAVPQRTHR